MFAGATQSRARRRGIVLVLVLGMLGLMALIGVTFATFAGQSMIAGRNFAQGVGRPQAEALMDYALAQLINDTNNPLSAIRGHSLLRDMYGNDSVFKGVGLSGGTNLLNPSANTSAQTGGLITSYFGTTPQLTKLLGLRGGGSSPSPKPSPFGTLLQYSTNIPTGGPFYGMDFTRWIVKFPFVLDTTGNGNSAVSQTFEILEDDVINGGGVHLFTLSAALTNGNLPNASLTASGDTTSFVYYDPNMGATVDLSKGTVTKGFTSLTSDLSGYAFVLDGRYMRAFNGPGLSQTQLAGSYPHNLAAYANFRIANSWITGGLDPDGIGMDEDYDACDLENWFLGIQSADGQVVIPSFHRPGILTGPNSLLATGQVHDWAAGATPAQRSKILRPRQVDHSPLFPPDPMNPDSNGKLTYDVDNDGDGVTDSVWLDLGYPVQRDPLTSKLYKPLFAFMVLGLNGRLPLNTVGNLQYRAIGDNTNTLSSKTGETLPDGTTPGPSSVNSGAIADATVQVPYPGPYTAPTASPDSYYFQPHLSSQVYLDAPLWDHASHLGYSVNEINPKFALQNAPSNVYPDSSQNVAANIYGVFPGYSGNYGTSSYSQYDNVGVSVALTQLRNILAGTVPTDVPQNPVSIANNLTAAGTVNWSTLPAYPKTTTNFDLNVVLVDGQPYVLPNNVADSADTDPKGSTMINRPGTAVAGRWGEVQGVPHSLPFVANNPGMYGGPIVYPGFWYTNPVRAGRSFYTGGTNDVMDDDFDAFDPYLPTSLLDTASGFSLEQVIPSGKTATPYEIPLNYTAAYTSPAPFSRTHPEFIDFFDPAGQMGIASERIRRFTTPIDPSGTGRMVAFQPSTRSASSVGASTFSTRPTSENDYGTGPDDAGRLAYFRYFRPAGMPQEIRYPYSEQVYGALSYGNTAGNAPFAGNPGIGQQYLMPVLLPAGQSSNPGPASKSDTHNNHYHGYQAALTPALNVVNAQNVAYMAPMPYNWDMNGNMGSGAQAQGYGYTYNPSTGAQVSGSIDLLAPTINPAGLLASSSWGPVQASPPTTYNLGYGPTVANGYLGTEFLHPSGTFYQGGGSLNIDEADEMNLYATSLFDQPYGPSDLEWLYRLQDVDGATLNSRLSKLAPVSFLNPADGMTRRRLFSTDSWDLNRFAYANDNPGGQFYYNSRFLPNASPSLQKMNQVVATSTTAYSSGSSYPAIPNLPFTPDFTWANPISEFMANPTFTTTTVETSVPALNPKGSLFANASASGATAVQVQTPSIAHGDRKINLNFPLPISNDPAEPVRQKWCRETYQMLKAILPPASIDTPEELAALSQFVVNIVDFRDTDCTMTRFVNTDLEVTDVLTQSANNTQGNPLDPTWVVSPAGVKFATDSPSSFPYDPALYHPDTVTTFLVQHGMEYNPIAINEAMAYQAQYGSATTANPNPPLTTYQAMFVELVNTLTEELNNSGAGNASAISLAGWDIVVAPDAYGWGRPDPISGDVNQVAFPPWVPNTSGDPTMPPAATQRPNTSPTPTDQNLLQIQSAVQQYAITTGGASAPVVTAINKGGSYGAGNNIFIIGDYRAAGASIADPTTIEGTNPVAKASEINVRLPLSFTIPTPPTGTAQYYWVYLRRPANPFDTAPPNQVRPNKEMVVVDAMRFPVINAANATLTGGATPTIQVNGKPLATSPSPANAIYSAQRLQPYRGGHLIPNNTKPGAGAVLPTAGSAANVTTICPPSPPYAYGYSEQMSAPPAGNGNGVYSYISGGKTMTLATTNTIQQSINNTNGSLDSNWSHIAFNDRDFTSVAELLLVPSCPPGLFTKQFVEEPYPGNIFANTAKTTVATGTDDTTLNAASPIVAPTGTTNPSHVGRKDFGPAGSAPLPADVTFPYLSDNFYYTAASVSPPSGNSDPAWTYWTSEIGGWTGAGWHKMLEFFEVPSSANGATGYASNGSNYDWYRADIKPGLINLNLIIDEEVFAGLVDDPRLNETLAVFSSSIPAVVTQIDGNGYPVFDTSTGLINGAQPVFNLNSQVPAVGGGVWNGTTGLPAGRGYTARDNNLADYAASPYVAQQIHGMRAAFADFLKLRHGGSGYLFAFGAGPTGSGDYPTSITLNAANNLYYPVVQSNPYIAVPTATGFQTQPVAAERPYRSLSYPDINLTIMRPASLPPSPQVSNGNGGFVYSGTTPPSPIAGTPLPSGDKLQTDLTLLDVYQPFTGPPHVQLQPAVAPMDQSKMATPGVDFQYLYDPGVKNPYLPIQFVNQTASQNNPAGSTPRAPPYDQVRFSVTVGSNTVAQPPAAPFPPSIPPTPARRLFQIPDHHRSTAGYSSNASITGQVDTAAQGRIAAAIAGGTAPTDNDLAIQYTINQPTITQQVSTGVGAGLSGGTATPPTLVLADRSAFLPDNYTPQANTTIRNYLGAGATIGATTDNRQHPLYRTEMLQKVMNLTTVRTHQFAVWITVGFFEVVQTGTPEMGIPDTLGQEVGIAAGRNVRYRSFFTLDRTRATGFNPYYPGDFRNVVTYRRRIE